MSLPTSRVVSSVCQAPVKSAFSLSIRTFDGEVQSGNRIESQITKTNLSDHALLVGGNRTADYTYEVRRNGVLLPETEQAKNLREHPLPGPMIDGNLAPHQWAVDTVAVNEFCDMRQPGVGARQMLTREERHRRTTAITMVDEEYCSWVAHSF